MKLPRFRWPSRSVQQWAGIVAALSLAGFLMYSVDVQGARVDALAGALADEQDAAEDRGDTPVAPQPSELLDDPTYSPQPGEPGPPPSDEQVRAAIADYFAEHPVADGADASPEQIAAAVAEYLVENPPERGATGPPPSSQQVADAVQEYLTENPPPSGPPGEKGEPGRAPTAAEIADAVEAYIAEHPIDWCPAGTEPQEHDVLTTTGGTVTAVICVKR